MTLYPPSTVFLLALAIAATLALCMWAPSWRLVDGLLMWFEDLTVSHPWAAMLLIVVSMPTALAGFALLDLQLQRWWP